MRGRIHGRMRCEGEKSLSDTKMTRARARCTRTVLYGKLLFLCHFQGSMTLLSEGLREIPSVCS